MIIGNPNKRYGMIRSMLVWMVSVLALEGYSID